MEITKMSVVEVDKAVSKATDDELRTAYAEEKAAGPDKERKGAIAALEAEAMARGITLTVPNAATDAELAGQVPGAQPAGGNATEEDRARHAEALARAKEELGITALEGKVAALEDGSIPSGADFDARTEILKLHRALEAMANHLNFRLPN